ncbi:hypothetical protein DUT91_14315 [Phyllobacterium salinisoli]|uniref:Uncharacterized protein n=1 Tax=Phyllobacterium salinisoli TaxID=1899321 RepID=A0A368K4N0_9HYPH|nr:hypothetical protein DUT91_14315 [Phyllobacterium salinisoli]
MAALQEMLGCICFLAFFCHYRPAAFHFCSAIRLPVLRLPLIVRCVGHEWRVFRTGSGGDAEDFKAKKEPDLQKSGFKF